jgi:ABC-type multidrug transport system ATPase subunit
VDLLSFRQVSKSFGEVVVLEDVSLDVSSGAIVGLIGDNGAGKTTLLRLAAHILTPTAGRILLLGEEGAVAARRRIGASLERPGHYDELTVFENLKFFYSFYGDSTQGLDDRVAMELDRLRLTPVARRTVGQLSTGYRQRLAIARAFHPWAQLILLDEPLEGLDPIARTHVKERLLLAKAEGKSVVLSSHTLRDIEQLSDSILLVADRAVQRFDNFDAIQEAVGVKGTVDLDVLYSALRESPRSRGIL